VPLLAVLAVRGVTGREALTPVRWVVGGALTATLAAGWWRQLPELLDRWQRLAATGGWNTLLPF